MRMDELTRDPAAIEATRRPLPIGFWKGSGLAILLDVVAAGFPVGWRRTRSPPTRCTKRSCRRCSLP